MKSVFGVVALVAISLFMVSLKFPTTLKITTLNELGNVEDSVKVTLYRTAEDYREEVNPVQEPQFTDAKGRTTFKGLEPTAYYVFAVKGDKTNVGAGVVTDSLKEGKINKLTIIIE